jgi:hypothetical protein
MADEREEKTKSRQKWDWEHAERHAGRRKTRAVVSVAFNRDDFEKVALFAERANMKLSEFIRFAAIGCAEGNNLLASVTAGSPDAPSASYLTPSPSTRVAETPVTFDEQVTEASQ